MTQVEGSHVPRSVWPVAVVVCGGWMTGRLEMGMLTRVWTGSCWVAASVLATAAGGRGARVVVGGGSWFELGFGLGGVAWVALVAFAVLGAAWGGVGGGAVAAVVIVWAPAWCLRVECSVGVWLEIQEDLGPQV